MMSGLGAAPVLTPAKSRGISRARVFGIGNSLVAGLAAAFPVWISATQFAFAQTASATWGAPTAAPAPGAPTTFSSSISEAAPSDQQTQMMMPFGLWTLYPSLIVDAVYDDNVYRTAVSPVAAAGVHVNPIVKADFNKGLHRFQLVGNFDGTFYPALQNGRLITGIAQGSYNWEILRDLNFQLRGGFERSLAALTNLNALNNAVTFAPTPATVASNSQYTNMYRAGASLEKGFNHVSAALGVSFMRMESGGFQGGQQGTNVGSTQFNNVGQNLNLTGQNLNNDGQGLTIANNSTYTVSGRLGYELTTDNYCYVQGSGNRIIYDAAFRNSKGYSAILGLGSKRLGFFRGEIYGGYQEQFYDNPTFGSSAGPTFGGKIEYLPTPLLAVTVAFAESVANYATAPLNTSAAGRSSTINTSIATVSYSFARDLSGLARFGYEWDNLGLNKRMSAGGRLSYNIDRNFDLHLDYLYTRAGILLATGPILASAATSTSQSLAFYTENRVTLGVAYKY